MTFFFAGFPLQKKIILQDKPETFHLERDVTFSDQIFLLYSLYVLQLGQNASQGKRSAAPAPHKNQAKPVPLGAGSLPVHVPSRAG